MLRLAEMLKAKSSSRGVGPVIWKFTASQVWSRLATLSQDLDVFPLTC